MVILCYNRNILIGDCMKYIVTGAAGFIGGHLAERLLKEGEELIIIDDLSGGKQENIDYLATLGKLTFEKRSIADNLDDIFEKNQIDGVFHFAALPRVQFSIAEPIKTHEANVNGTLNLLDACKKYDVNRFVFSSSSSVYGDQPTLPLTEDMIPNPLSPYALHKLVGEHYCRLYSSLYGMQTVALRYFNVYGPKQDPEGAYAPFIPKFIDKFLHGVTPEIFGDGKQTRDFTFVTDVVEANITAMRTENKEAFGQVFNVGAGNNVSVNEVAANIKKLAKSDIEPKHGPAVVEARDSLADTTKAEKVLGWKAKVPFEEGIAKVFEFFAGKFAGK